MRVKRWEQMNESAGLGDDAMEELRSGISSA